VKSASAVFSLALFALGCGGAATPEPVLSPASSTSITVDRSLSLLTSTRCDRERVCGNVGPEQRYADRSECVKRLDERGYEELGYDECLLGIDRARLERCLAQIRSDSCESRLDNAGKFAACRSRAVCFE
jgi:hypothetical protein